MQGWAIQRGLLWGFGLHPQSHKARKETSEILPREIPPNPTEKRLGRGSEWTPANLQFLELHRPGQRAASIDSSSSSTYPFSIHSQTQNLDSILNSMDSN